jgi:hypothetical protein
MNETISRILLALEAIGLLLPLSLLYGLLVVALLDDGVGRLGPGDADWLIGVLLAGAGLIALWRLIGTAVYSGIAALHSVHRAWMLFCMFIGVWVLIACLIQVGVAWLDADPLNQPGMRGLMLGLFGLPALVPLAHLAAEQGWRKRGVV